MSAKPRACGTCNACCSALTIDELDKPAHVACDRLGAKGCARYDERPTSCRTFSCAWLTNSLPAEMRPDRSGLIVWANANPAFEGALLVNECTPGALSRPESLRFLQSVSKTTALMVTPMRGAQTIFGPESKARKVRLAIVGDEPEMIPCEVTVEDDASIPGS